VSSLSLEDPIVDMYKQGSGKQKIRKRRNIQTNVSDKVLCPKNTYTEGKKRSGDLKPS